METEQKLRAPKAVFGLRKKLSSTRNLNKNETFDLPNLRLSAPVKSESFRNLPMKYPKTTREKSRFALNQDMEKDFEELSIKQEIFGILLNDSTFCDSPFPRSSEKYDFEENVNFFNQNDIDLDKSIDIIQGEENLIKENFINFLNDDFEKENMNSVYIQCKKL